MTFEEEEKEIKKNNIGYKKQILEIETTIIIKICSSQQREEKKNS